MSSNVFPSLKGYDVQVTREVFYSNDVHEAISGKETRISFWSTPRYRYRIKVNFARAATSAPAPWAAYSEPAILFKFLDDHLGRNDSFLFNDPYDSVQRAVRFEEDTLSMTRVVDQVWSCELTLVSVK